MTELRIPKHKRQTVSHTRSRLQEREVAVRLGGQQVHRSGAGDEKGDVRLRGVVRIECKATRNKSFSITRDMVRKVEEAGLGSGELAVIVVEFLDSRGKVESRVAVAPYYLLDMIKATS